MKPTCENSIERPPQPHARISRRPLPRSRAAALLASGLVLVACQALPPMVSSALVGFGQDVLAAAAQNFAPGYAQSMQNLLFAMAETATGAPFTQQAQTGYQDGAYDQPAYEQGGDAEQAMQEDYSGGYSEDAWSEGEQPGYPEGGGYVAQAQAGYDQASPDHGARPGIGLEVALLAQQRGPDGKVHLRPVVDGDTLHDGRGDPARGDKLKLFFSANCACFVYVIGIDATGFVAQLAGQRPSVPADFRPVREPAIVAMTRGLVQVQSAAPAKARPSVDELLELIGRQRGGKEELERARKGGRPDQPLPRASMADRAAEWFAWLPPLISPAHAAGALSVTVTPKVNSAGAHAGLKGSASSETGSLVLTAYSYGSYLSYVATNSTHTYWWEYARNWDSNTSSRSQRPYLYTSVGVPNDGYYIVNTRVSSGSGVQLRRYQAGSYPIVQTFDALGSADRPALLYLTKGYHHFYWVFPGGYYFYSASVDSYP